MNILVTGGCGFIGSNFVRFVLENSDHNVTNLDALTYAGNEDNLKDFGVNGRYNFIRGRIEDRKLARKIIENVDFIINFAAETHVDRSILEPTPFLTTNITGTQTLLEACKGSNVKKFVHISTDEVYGSLEIEDDSFTEDLPLNPNSPYSASKAAADLLAKAYHTTYGLPVVIIRPSNNYGYYQFPEKFIPLAVTNILDDKPIPIYGEGKNIRDWIFVEDCCNGIYEVLKNGKAGETYNLGGESERKNIDLVANIIKLMGKDSSFIEFVKDRPGHDLRYALNNSKIRSEVGWKPSTKFEDGLEKTIKWYQKNDSWWKPLKERLEKESGGFWS